MQTDLGLTRDQLREEMLAILRESHPRRSPLPPVKAESAFPLARPVEDFPEVKPRTKAIEVWNGSVCVRIYKMKWRDQKRRKTYRKFELRWTDAGKQFRQKKSNLEQAKKRAEQIAGAISSGETNRLQFSQADIASLFRIKDMASAVGVEPELLVAEACESRRMLSGVATSEAIRFYNLHHPTGIAPKTSKEIAGELFAQTEMSNKWKRNLKLMLDRFVERFPGPLSDLSTTAIAEWLGSLKDKRKKLIGLHARHNHRGAVLQLCNFAKSSGYLPEAWNIVEKVKDLKRPRVRVNVYTPEELLRLLNTAESYEAGRKLVPFIAITAFAGVRHGEMNEDKIELLDWRHIDFVSKTIVVGEDTAKTGAGRLVDMPDNLIAWLKPYARAGGKIIALKNSGNALCRLRTKAGIKGPKRNALRKSFISYKKALSQDIARVADQAGNSPAVIRKNYLWVDNQMKADAERWFSLMPDRADLLPLFAWCRPAAV
jgi:integrase